MSSIDFERIVRKTIESFHVECSSETDMPIEKSFIRLLEKEVEDLSRASKNRDRDLSIETNRDCLFADIVRKTRHKSAKKRQKLLFYQHEIERLRENEGMSWREIANYLAIRHKFKINYSTIAKFMQTQRERND